MALKASTQLQAGSRVATRGVKVLGCLPIADVADERLQWFKALLR